MIANILIALGIAFIALGLAGLLLRLVHGPGKSGDQPPAQPPPS
jgi:hypothetical protein